MWRCFRREVIVGPVVTAVWSLAAAGCLESVQGYEVDPVDQHEELPGEDAEPDDADDPPEDDEGPLPAGPGAGLVGTWGQLVNMTVIQSGVPLLGSSWAASRNW